MFREQECICKGFSLLCTCIFFLEVLSLASKRTGITFLELDSLGGWTKMIPYIQYIELKKTPQNPFSKLAVISIYDGPLRFHIKLIKQR